MATRRDFLSGSLGALAYANACAFPAPPKGGAWVPFLYLYRPPQHPTLGGVSLLPHPVRERIPRDHPNDLTVLLDEAHDLTNRPTAGRGHHAKESVTDRL